MISQHVIEGLAAAANLADKAPIEHNPYLNSWVHAYPCGSAEYTHLTSMIKALIAELSEAPNAIYRLCVTPWH